MKKLFVELEFDEEILGPAWMNIDNLKSCLFTKEFTKPELLSAKILGHPDTGNIRAEAIGWCHADACTTLDEGGDPRKTNVPDMLKRAEKDLNQSPEP